ncbi:hypothetical protein AMECASPLE_023314 [Ameca splendens]|uniref:Uncharacterized protein n=1 Tax=Ameca splendens TaxID=208324 RepID=A0ABV0YQZ3_9TELE
MCLWTGCRNHKTKYVETTTDPLQETHKGENMKLSQRFTIARNYCSRVLFKVIKLNKSRNALAGEVALRSVLPVGVIVCEAIGQQENCRNLYQHAPEYVQHPLHS